MTELEELNNLIELLKATQEKKRRFVSIQEYELAANLRLEEHKIFNQYLRKLSDSKSIDSLEKKKLLVKFFEIY